MLAFSSILLTALAAFAGASIWIIAIGAAILFSISLKDQRALANRFSKLGLTHVLNMAHWQSAMHAILASGAAFGLGAISRLALGI